jgi:hypothetical protein
MPGEKFAVEYDPRHLTIFSNIEIYSVKYETETHLSSLSSLCLLARTSPGVIVEQTCVLSERTRRHTQFESTQYFAQGWQFACHYENGPNEIQRRLDVSFFDGS